MTGHTDLAGKVAIVTGAAGGIGGATARRLSAEGAHVVVVDRNAEGARRVAQSLPTAAAWVAADVSREEDVDRYLATAVDRFGRVDLHHVHAGISGSFAALPDIPLADFRQVMNVNVVGAFLGVRAAFRQYRAQGSGGAVVLTASIASLRGGADLLPYQVSKTAVLGLLRGAALYGGPIGVRVNAVAPGIVPTELFAANPTVAGGRDDMVRRASTTPLRRAGTPEEIAAVVAFLLSDDASYLTGEVVSVDGGAAAVNIVRPSGGAGAWDTHAVDTTTYPDLAEEAR
jgi:NAD(P)-dependent dehydrogenase (short-subunit alcohol dehydrogenase family)